MQQPTSFAAGVTSFDRGAHREVLQEAEGQRQEMLRRFPLPHWPEMTIEEYALGHEGSENTFCRWLEFKTKRLGFLAGGTARKHLIFKRKHGEGWYFDPQYTSVNDAWEHVRAGFVQMFDLAKKQDWDSIDEVQALRSGGAVRAKTLHVYWPTDVLPISSRDHILYFLRQLNSPASVQKTADVVRLNRLLLAELRRRPQVADWTSNELAAFLYHWADPREVGKIVKIAPGEGAKYWPD